MRALMGKVQKKSPFCHLQFTTTYTTLPLSYNIVTYYQMRHFIVQQIRTCFFFQILFFGVFYLNLLYYKVSYSILGCYIILREYFSSQQYYYYCTLLSHHIVTMVRDHQGDAHGHLSSDHVIDRMIDALAQLKLAAGSLFFSLFLKASLQHDGDG